MIEEIQTLSDKTQFEKILNTFFINNNLTLKLKNREVTAKYIGYSGEQAGFRITDLKNVPDDCIIEFKNETYTIYLYLKFIEKQEKDVFIFKPLKFQFISQARHAERIPLNDTGKKVLYITGVISDFIINNILSQRLKVIYKIKNTILSDMEKVLNK
jgi:hypothetical protein